MTREQRLRAGALYEARFAQEVLGYPEGRRLTVGESCQALQWLGTPEGKQAFVASAAQAIRELPVSDTVVSAPPIANAADAPPARDIAEQLTAENAEALDRLSRS